MILIYLDSHKGHIEQIYCDEAHEVFVIDVDDESDETICISKKLTDPLFRTPLEIIQDLYWDAGAGEPTPELLEEWKQSLGSKSDYHLSPTPTVGVNPEPKIGDWGIFRIEERGVYLIDFYASYYDARKVFLSDFVGEKEWDGNVFLLGPNSSYELKRIREIKTVYHW
jgi:hypothetical protein